MYVRFAVTPRKAKGPLNAHSVVRTVPNSMNLQVNAFGRTSTKSVLRRDLTKK